MLKGKEKGSQNEIADPVHTYAQVQLGIQSHVILRKTKYVFDYFVIVLKKEHGKMLNF